MNVAIKIILFICMVFLIGGLWQVFNIAIQDYNQVMDNTSGIDHDPFPAVTNIYDYMWLAIPLVIGFIGTAIWLINKRDNIGGYY